MKIIGADLSRATGTGEPPDNAVVALDEAGGVAAARHPANLPGVADAIVELAAGEPFLVGVNLAVVRPSKASRSRPVDNLVRRRFGHRLRPTARAAAGDERGAAAGASGSGDALIAGLAAAGQPCLPYPDRDRRTSGLAEIHPELVLKALLWERSAVSRAGRSVLREDLFRSLGAPPYRVATSPRRATWADRAAAMDLVLQALAPLEGYDLRPAREALVQAASTRDVERAGALLDAALLAGTARRYLESPETCLFLGDREAGYVILPADGFVRRLALRDVRPRRGGLFPRSSLRQRLGADAELRPLELLSVEGQPQRLEASFHDPPRYEFDNVDEMLWWKHCRHLAGPALPTEGLHELLVQLGPDGPEGGRASPLRLTRSRHRTLSFRFDPPAQWRTRLPTRDGKTYPFRVLRAVYETAPREAAAD